MTKKRYIAIGVLILVAIAAAVIPAFIRARNTPSSYACINNLRMIDGAKLQWGLENSKTNNANVTWSEILPYLGRGVGGEMPICPKGGTYILGKVGENPKCSCGDTLP